jgi:hypothetical protein
MPDFQKGPNYRTPFGRNVYLRSTQDIKTTSMTVAKGSVPAVTIDGFADQKVLQPGTVLAKITSGPDSGKIGPFSAAATDGRQTAANIVGLCNTFLPWQLMERDVEVAVVYECTAVQAWCFEYNVSNARVALTNTTADAMRGKKNLDIMFH